MPASNAAGRDASGSNHAVENIVRQGTAVLASEDQALAGLVVIWSISRSSPGFSFPPALGALRSATWTNCRRPSGA